MSSMRSITQYPQLVSRLNSPDSVHLSRRSANYPQRVSDCTVSMIHLSEIITTMTNWKKKRREIQCRYISITTRLHVNVFFLSKAIRPSDNRQLYCRTVKSNNDYHLFAMIIVTIYNRFLINPLKVSSCGAHYKHKIYMHQ